MPPDHKLEILMTARDTSRRAFEQVTRRIKSIGIVATAAAGTAAYAMQRIGREAIALAIEQEKAEAKLEAVVRATGKAAGFSADEIKKYAGELQKVTGIGDEVTISAAAVLGTFKNIKGIEFKDTIKAMQNVATVMESDLKTQAVSLGKALNDPVANLGQLSKTGIQFTKDQKQTIKTLWEMGKTAEAQKIILKELESQFGGAAKAARETFGGAVDATKGYWNDFLESLGEIVTKNEDIKQFVNDTGESFQTWTKWVKESDGALNSLLSTMVKIPRAANDVVWALDIVAQNVDRYGRSGLGGTAGGGPAGIGGSYMGLSNAPTPFNLQPSPGWSSPGTRTTTPLSLGYWYIDEQGINTWVAQTQDEIIDAWRRNARPDNSVNHLLFGQDTAPARMATVDNFVKNVDQQIADGIKANQETDKALEGKFQPGSPYSGLPVTFGEQFGNEVGYNISSGLGSGIGTSLYDVLTGQFEDIDDAWKQVLKSMLASFLDFIGRLAAQKLVGKVGGWFGFGGGSGTSGGGGTSPMGVVSGARSLYSGGQWVANQMGWTGGQTAVDAASAGGASGLATGGTAYGNALTTATVGPAAEIKAMGAGAGQSGLGAVFQGGAGPGMLGLASLVYILGPYITAGMEHALGISKGNVVKEKFDSLANIAQIYEWKQSGGGPYSQAELTAGLSRHRADLSKHWDTSWQARDRAGQEAWLEGRGISRNAMGTYDWEQMQWAMENAPRMDMSDYLQESFGNSINAIEWEQIAAEIQTGLSGSMEQEQNAIEIALALSESGMATVEQQMQALGFIGRDQGWTSEAVLELMGSYVDAGVDLQTLRDFLLGEGLGTTTVQEVIGQLEASPILADQMDYGLPPSTDLRSVYEHGIGPSSQLNAIWDRGIKVNAPDYIPVRYGDAAGGLINYATGGWVNSHPTGGIIQQGSGIRDDVYLGPGPAGVHHWGMGGEYVINKVSTRKYKPLLDAINKDRLADAGVEMGGRPIHLTNQTNVYLDGKLVDSRIEKKIIMHERTKALGIDPTSKLNMGAF